MQDASDRDWKSFKYGINPRQRALRNGADHPVALNGEPLSLNAFMDVQLGVSILRGLPDGLQGIVYIKHKMPIVAAMGVDTQTASVAFVEACARGENVEFGCAVASFPMGTESLPLLEEIRLHTIAAPEFSSTFVERLHAATIQTANRGLSPVATGTLGVVTDWDMQFSDGSVVCYQDAAIDPDPELDNAVSNSRWIESTKLKFGLSVLRHARTIAVVIMHDGLVAMVRCGFYDGLQALRQSLQMAKDAGISLSRATVLTDGCFGVRSPVSTLTEFGVQSFVFCGLKNNDMSVLSDLDQAGVAALCTKTRYFFY